MVRPFGAQVRVSSGEWLSVRGLMLPGTPGACATRTWSPGTTSAGECPCCPQPCGPHSTSRETTCGIPTPPTYWFHHEPGRCRVENWDDPARPPNARDLTAS